MIIHTFYCSFCSYLFLFFFFFCLLVVHFLESPGQPREEGLNITGFDVTGTPHTETRGSSPVASDIISHFFFGKKGLDFFNLLSRAIKGETHTKEKEKNKD